MTFWRFPERDFEYRISRYALQKKLPNLFVFLKWIFLLRVRDVTSFINSYFYSHKFKCIIHDSAWKQEKCVSFTNSDEKNWLHQNILSCWRHLESFLFVADIYFCRIIMYFLGNLTVEKKAIDKKFSIHVFYFIITGISMHWNDKFRPNFQPNNIVYSSVLVFPEKKNKL